ncbi:COG4122 Predicted O-methyltransferase [Candidatus Nanopelagicaceae bacterium]
MYSAISLITSLLILAAVAYQIRTLRRVNEKLIKLVSPERDARKLLKENERAARENYRQSEFYIQLIHLLNLKAPIPSTRSWAASPDLLLTLLQLARSSSPRVIVDLGSGMSTLVLAKGAPQAKIFSIDNSEEFAAKTQLVLSNHDVTNVDLRVAPLTPHSSGVDWYDLSKFGDISNIDLLFIDGPPGSKNPEARHPAITECITKLSPQAIIVIDDVARAGERAMAEEFARLLPSHSLEYLDHEKGSAVLRPR